MTNSVRGDYKKPLPDVSDPTWAPFWEAAKRHQLAMQHCVDCGHLVWPAGPVCTECLSANLEWRDLSGRGTLFTWTRFHQGYHPEWAKETPYNVSLVMLEEGVIFLTNVTNVADDDLSLGMPLDVWFDDVTDEVSIPKFRPREP